MIASGDWWTLDDDGVLDIFIQGAMPDYSGSPNDIPWYSNRTAITSIVLENSVTAIGDQNFYGCRNAQSVTIPISVTSIGAGAFLACSSLASITIPNSVTFIDEQAFAASGLTSVILPSNISSISNGLFLQCGSLASVTIPISVTSIGDNAFMPWGSSPLTDVYYGGTETDWGNGCTYFFGVNSKNMCL